MYIHAMIHVKLPFLLRTQVQNIKSRIHIPADKILYNAQNPLINSTAWLVFQMYVQYNFSFKVNFSIPCRKGFRERTAHCSASYISFFETASYTSLQHHQETAVSYTTVQHQNYGTETWYFIPVTRKNCLLNSFFTEKFAKNMKIMRFWHLHPYPFGVGET